MKKRVLKFLPQIDMTAIFDRTEQLFKLELAQTFEAYHASADKAVELLRNAGIPNVEKLTFPADGKTVWQDKISPLGWTASEGKIVVVSAVGIEPGTVVADYRKHPFYLIKGSCSTLHGGEIMRLLSYEQVVSGADPAGALVLSPVAQDCRCRVLPRLLDLGARGIVSDFSFNYNDAPEGILWNTAFTEHDNWHVNADDRDFIAFSIPPATGKTLRKAVEKGEVLLNVSSDGRRFEDTVDLVTACIPGRRKEEFWIYAHLYEPMANDNSSGVACAVETARLILAEEQPEFSLRLLFGLEHYGFAAYAVHRGNKNLSDEVIGACDYDAMRIRNDWNINLRCAPAGTPFFGNFLLHKLAEDFADFPGTPQIKCLDAFNGMYDDDAFLSDSTTGVPTIWPIREGEGIYHNSLQSCDYIEKDALRFACAVNTALVSAFLSPQKEMAEQAVVTAQNVLKKESARAVGSQKEHLSCRYDILFQDMKNFSRCFSLEYIEELWQPVRETFEALSGELSDKIPRSPLRDRAEKMIPARLTVGFPFDLAQIPFKKRILLPGSVLYGPLAAVLSNMDGSRDLASIFRKTEHEICSSVSEEELKKLIDAIEYLASSGYIRLTFK